MKKKYEESDIQSIADSIRVKTGKAEKMKLSDMASAVSNINSNAYLEAYLIGVLTSMVFNGAEINSIYNLNLEKLTLTSSSVVSGVSGIYGSNLKAIYVPSNLLESYKSSDEWSSYSDIFQSI